MMNQPRGRVTCECTPQRDPALCLRANILVRLCTKRGKRNLRLMDGEQNHVGVELVQAAVRVENLLTVLSVMALVRPEIHADPSRRQPQHGHELRCCIAAE